MIVEMLLRSFKEARHSHPGLTATIIKAKIKWSFKEARHSHPGLTATITKAKFLIK
ncbi:hypothetical protein SERLA73DRAFT_163276 [Serpula lacrymans var. lacrymans S7.3]|uniref:Uncharacterized protein n=1 Tax=Serpula lacrymans var. lacrymans (strain S7.3) TaxID=936435 RepID=F8QCL0_SERL3|nr:hypothetical protein SERLA73DRAFT_163276 [Serpula lacrymans var. lacrymans S7.3]